MRARFLLGPAGSGKTFRCLAGIREELIRSPQGPDLILLAPKQSTFQLERQLMSDGSIKGYTRLRILSFERLAAHLFECFSLPLPALLSEEGRVMVLRRILQERRQDLNLFRASSRLSGFARHLSRLLHELQQRRVGPEQLRVLAARPGVTPRLSAKLTDLALLMEGYLQWVGGGATPLGDAPQLLDLALGVVRENAADLQIGGLWLDGFAALTPQELTLLGAIIPHCRDATLAFCLPEEPSPGEPWLSPWSVVSDTARECLVTLQAIPEVETEVDLIGRELSKSRFSGSPLLAQVEESMATAGGWRMATATPPHDPDILETSSLRLVECSNVETEARLAAREICGFVRSGGRYRECAVLLRSLEGYQEVLRRVFNRYNIPFFLDRRESVAHHPLAELTRSVIRLVAFDWRREDWFAALKTGLTPLTDSQADRLENLALARGWEGASLWLNPLSDQQELRDPETSEELRARATATFAAFQQELTGSDETIDGVHLARAFRSLWSELQVEGRLEAWMHDAPGKIPHATVLDQMLDWVDNLERAFDSVSLSVSEWVPIVESGLSGLTIGVVPPSLDQVLVGSVDRSRNPDLRLALVLGANESVFPATPTSPPLLSDLEAIELEDQGVRLGSFRRQFSHEHYLSYIALTRSRERVIVTWSATDEAGRPRNPSRIVDALRRAVPSIPTESFDGHLSWQDCVHPCELAPMVLGKCTPFSRDSLKAIVGLKPLLDHWHRVRQAGDQVNLTPSVAIALHGSSLQLSVSALEQFSACPFQFLVGRGLRAQERDEFSVDARRTGEFQHEVLAAFHRRLIASGRRWREVSPEEASSWIQEIGEAELERYRHGLLAADATRRFQASALIASLEGVIAALTQWARQNDFEPTAVEISFGLEEDGWPGWTLELDGGHSLTIRGRVDRVDLLKLDEGSAAVAILDYKSSSRKFDPLKFANGLELQMPAYLTALCNNPAARTEFGADSLVPAGVFYIGLRSTPAAGSVRADVEEAERDVAADSHRHRGRFDEALVKRFDTRGGSIGDQFVYRYKKSGELARTGNDALETTAFSALLEDATQQIRSIGNAILGGEARVSPYRNGQDFACDWCRFRSVCRFDPWVQPYRLLKREFSATKETD